MRCPVYWGGELRKPYERAQTLQGMIQHGRGSRGKTIEQALRRGGLGRLAAAWHSHAWGSGWSAGQVGRHVKC